LIFKTSNLYEKEYLPWSEYIPSNANKLILGTFPTREARRHFEFFYPNKQNRFWKVLANLAKVSLSDFDSSESGKILAIAERKKILNALRLGITDMGAIVLRQNSSSLDTNLFPLEFSDIFKLLEVNRLIDTIILTSSTGGNSVLSWFKAYCKINNVDLKIRKKGGCPKESQIMFEDREIRIVVVWSSSSASVKKEVELTEQYKKFLI